MLRYAEIIKESETELRELEKRHRNSVEGNRISMLRRLKSGEARSLQAAAKQLSYSLRQCQRWFKSYQVKGLAALLVSSGQGKSSHERMTKEAWKALEAAMERGEISKANDARELVAQYGVIYQSNSSLLKLFERHKIKAKTARPRNQKADVNAQERFKKLHGEASCLSS